MLHSVFQPRPLTQNFTCRQQHCPAYTDGFCAIFQDRSANIQLNVTFIITINVYIIRKRVNYLMVYLWMLQSEMKIFTFPFEEPTDTLNTVCCSVNLSVLVYI